MTREALFYPISLGIIEMWFCLMVYCFTLVISTDSDKYMRRTRRSIGIVLTCVCAVSLYFGIWYFQHNYLI